MQKDREFQTAVTDINQRKDSEIADLKRTIEVCRRQNQNIHKKLQERDSLIHELGKKCQLFDKIVRHRDSLQQILKLLDSLGPRGGAAGESVGPVHTASMNNSLVQPNANHLHAAASVDGADADESDQASDADADHPPPPPATFKELTQSFSRSSIRHFSISEDDSADNDDDRDSVFRKMKREKELYL